MKPNEPLVTYPDTSVFGGKFDDEFSEESTRFFKLAKAGVFRLVISDLTFAELMRAPDRVRDFYNTVDDYVDTVSVGENAEELKEAYLDQGILTRNWEEDALHVATATVSECDLIVSWNFKHLVNLRRIRLYNAVNQLYGYDTIEIRPPSAVIENE